MFIASCIYFIGLVEILYLMRRRVDIVTEFAK